MNLEIYKSKSYINTSFLTIKNLKNDLFMFSKNPYSLTRSFLFTQITISDKNKISYDLTTVTDGHF